MATSSSTAGFAKIAAFTVQIPLVAYVAATGHAPTWARIWMTSFLGIWLLATILTAAKAESR